MKNVMVIAIGLVKPNTGETGHGWNMYDQGGCVTLAGNFLLYHARKEDFEIGEDIELRGNDSNRKLKNTRVVDQAPADRESVLEMLLRNQYDYYPTRAFKKKRFPRKLTTSYSVKGITV